MCLWGRVGEDTGNKKRLDDDVSGRTPGGLPGSNVDIDEVHLQ